MTYTYSALALDAAGDPIAGRLYEVYTAKNGTRISGVVDLATIPGTAGYVTSATAPKGIVRWSINSDNWPAVWLKTPTGDWWGPLVADEITAQIPGTAADAAEALALATDAAATVGQITRSVGEFATAAQLNGAEDAGPAFQACIDALPAGGRMICPPGSVFWFSGATVARLKSNIELDLRGSTITKTSSAGYYCIFVGLSDGAVGYGSGPSNVTIRNGYFQGDLANGGTLCVLAGHHMQKVRIYDCEMVGCQGSGHTYDIAACDDVLFQGCIWRGCIPWDTPGRPETIELDQSLNGALSYVDTPGSFDGLLSRNVTLTDSQFLPYDDGVTVWPAPVPMGAHGQREGQWYENITVRNVYVEDPPKDTAPGTATGADDLYIRGLFHFPTVKGLHISNVRVVATDGLGTIRAVMVTGRTSGTLAAGDPNTETTSGVWAVSQGSHDITIEGLQVSGFLNTGSVTNPIVNIAGVTGANVENVRISMSVDGAYREAVLLYRVNDAAVEFVRCRDADSGARFVSCQNVSVSGKFTEVDLPVRLDGTTNASVGPCTDVRSATANAFVIVTNGANVVTCSNIQAPQRTWLYGASGVQAKPVDHSEGAIIGAAVV